MSGEPRTTQHIPIGPWAMDGKALNAFLANAAAARAQYGNAVDADVPIKLISDSAAVISITGNLTKYEADTWWDGCSMERVRAALAEAVADNGVRSIVLRICSPGGIAAGVDDVAREIAAAARVKPVVAYVEDFALSAAYWLASQATRIVACPAALVGSIGVYIALEDTSAAAQAAGVRVVLVRSGEFKGGSAPGVPLDEAEIADTERYVAELSGLFVQAVAAGRGMDAGAALALADGRTFIAAEALKLGLIDEIGTFNGALEQSESLKMAGALPAAQSGLATGAVTMAEEENKPAPPAAEDEENKGGATMAQLKEALPESTAEFREKAHLAGLNTDQATAMWEGEREQHMQKPGSEEEQTGSAPAASAAARTVKPAAKGPLPGVAPLEDRPGKPAAEASDSARAQVADAVARRLDEAKAAGRPITRAAAHAAVMKADPDLRERYTQEHNDAHPRTRPGRK